MGSLLGRQSRTLNVEAAPENEHGVQHQIRVADEAFLVDVVFRENLGQLVRCNFSMIGFNTCVPSEEADVEGPSALSLAVPFPSLDELVPESGGCPVLDGPGRG